MDIFVVSKTPSKEPELVMVSNIFYCFQVMSKLSYYALMTPYNVELVGEKKFLVIKTNRFQKLLCGFIHIFGLIAISCNMYNDLTGARAAVKDDPKQVFQIANSMSILIAIWSFSYLCWVKKRGLATLYETAYKYAALPEGRSLSNNKRIVIFAFLGFGCYMIPIIAWISENAKLMNDHSFKTLYKGHVFLDLNKNIIPEGGWGLDYALSFIVLIFQMLNQCYKEMVIPFLTSFACFILYETTSECSKCLGESNTYTVNQVGNYYTRLRTLMNTVNDVLGLQLLGFTLCVLVYFTKYLTELVLSDDVVTELFNIFYVVCSSMVLFMAAEGAIKKFGEYLFENRRKPGYRDNMEVLNLMNEVQRNPLGLKAHKFLITYGFIVTILSTILTYIVVLLQLSPISKTRTKAH